MADQPVDIRLPADAKFSVINATASGQNEVVAAVTGKRIRVVSYALTVSAAAIVQFRDGATTVIAGGFDLAANGGISFAGLPAAPAFQTSSGVALNINLSATVNARGHLCYIEV